MKQELVKDWMTADVITTDTHTPLPDAHQLMDRHNIRRLIVTDEGKPVGLVTRGDVRGAEPSEASSLSIWEMNYLLAKLEVGQIMTSKPITVSQDASIGDAARLMMEKKISGLPVIDADGKLVGIITESDIFRLVVKAWHADEV